MSDLTRFINILDYTALDLLRSVRQMNKGIRRKNRHIKRLQKENILLRHTVEFQQHALDISANTDT